MNKEYMINGMIYHIYWGTSGNSGLYLDEIYRVLKEHGYDQRVFVSYYYPFDYGDKLFFKRGDVANSKYKGLMRKIFQLLEVLNGYFWILCHSVKDRPAIINYSHVGSSYFFIVWFLRLLKMVSGAKLMITCHDVNPHGLVSGEMNNRSKIFHSADYLIVHNEKSKDELYKIFGIEKNRLVSHLFPIMDLSKLTNDCENPYSNVDFLFIGHLRKDKGIEFLLESWKEFHKVNKHAKLRIAGRCLPDVYFDKDELEKRNVEFQLRYIDDDEYYHYVKATRYVVLPYIQGTNSGIISTVLSLGTDVVTSNIPMFSENPLIPKDHMFKTEDCQSFVETLQKLYLISSKRENNLLFDYKKKFEKEVVETYEGLLHSCGTDY